MHAILLLVLLSFQCTQIDAFAAWLKCNVDLDETEVIMNHEVEPDDEIHLQARPEGSKEWLDSPITSVSSNSFYELRLVLRENYSQLQYVMEATSGGKFQDAICNGKRIHGEYVPGSVAGKVQVGASTKVCAGWATGHGPVKTTPMFEFLLESNHEEL